jgi:protein involved in polysaccharide export with SLBB domain
MSLSKFRFLPLCTPSRIARTLLATLALVTASVSNAQSVSEERTLDPVTTRTDGTIRLRQGQISEPARPGRAESEQSTEERRSTSRAVPEALYVPGEFERFVQKQAGRDVEVRRFASELVVTPPDAGSTELLSPLVPAEYVVAPGDEVLLTVWGSVDADLRLIVDRGGRISIPRVGAVQVSGLRYGDLQDVVSRRIAQVFKNFELSVTLGQLRGIRVLVTGFVVKPGGYTVTSLSTVVAALMRAGGPGASGSFRAVELKRGGRLVATVDLYDLLLKGDRSSDQILQAGDVVHVPAVGVQVGIVGSVNKPTVMELKPGETVADALLIAGGFSAVADRSRLAVERLQDRNAARVAQLDLPGALGQTLSHGDVLRAFSAVDIALPIQRQSKRVRVEGEVQRPAEYVLPEGSSVKDAIRAAGGYSTAAYLYATEFTRVSVQQTQQENYERALRDLETDLARASGSQRMSTAEEVAGAQARERSSSRLIDRLRTLRPTGRIVLQMGPDVTDLPDLALEDGDRIFVPARPTTVGVFGSVFNAASYLHLPGRTLDEYVKLAGGPTKGADDGSIFVIRANGNVVSGRQNAGWFNRDGGLGALPAEPGDTVFVPEEMDKTTWTQVTKDWTQILYQFGLGIAGIAAAFK